MQTCFQELRFNWSGNRFYTCWGLFLCVSWWNFLKSSLRQANGGSVIRAVGQHQHFKPQIRLKRGRTPAVSVCRKKGVGWACWWSGCPSARLYDSCSFWADSTVFPAVFGTVMRVFSQLCDPWLRGEEGGGQSTRRLHCGTINLQTALLCRNHDVTSCCLLAGVPKMEF